MITSKNIMSTHSRWRSFYAPEGISSKGAIYIYIYMPRNVKRYICTYIIWSVEIAESVFGSSKNCFLILLIKVSSSNLIHEKALQSRIKERTVNLALKFQVSFRFFVFPKPAWQVQSFTCNYSKKEIIHN